MEAATEVKQRTVPSPVTQRSLTLEQWIDLQGQLIFVAYTTYGIGGEKICHVEKSFHMRNAKKSEIYPVLLKNLWMMTFIWQHSPAIRQAE